MKAQTAEHPLFVRLKIPVGQVERGGHRHVLRVQEIKPVIMCGGQVSGQAGRRPRGVMVELAGQHRHR